MSVIASAGGSTQQPNSVVGHRHFTEGGPAGTAPLAATWSAANSNQQGLGAALGLGGGLGLLGIVGGGLYGARAGARFAGDGQMALGAAIIGGIVGAAFGGLGGLATGALIGSAID